MDYYWEASWDFPQICELSWKKKKKEEVNIFASANCYGASSENLQPFSIKSDHISQLWFNLTTKCGTRVIFAVIDLSEKSVSVNLQQCSKLDIYLKRIQIDTNQRGWAAVLMTAMLCLGENQILSAKLPVLTCSLEKVQKKDWLNV